MFQGDSITDAGCDQPGDVVAEKTEVVYDRILPEVMATLPNLIIILTESVVPLQEQISAPAEQASSGCVLVDGVHPTFAGHELISRAPLPGIQRVFIR